MSSSASLDPTPERAQEIADNISGVTTLMNEALAKLGDNAQKARLVAVSKYKPSSDIMAAYKTGHRHFGENYVQELVEKANELPKDIQWHFIGSLQSNKCKIVAAIPNLFVVETVDSAKKASTLDKVCANAGRKEPLQVYLQVNTSGEESKSGMTASEVVDVAREVVTKCSNLKLAGLMTIGSPDPDLVNGENPDFKGMSDDYQQAIQQGSTNIRVGSTIFGSRPRKAQ
ncbi:hypothetical protein BGW41_002672 [Actinomortierella wolfii]|nr:hypothetical protein BGW41_002672 [Actinomortierella wolfii]